MGDAKIGIFQSNSRFNVYLCAKESRRVKRDRESLCLLGSKRVVGRSGKLT